MSERRGDKVVFQLRWEHLELMKHSYMSWNESEFGAPTIDPKRPYGNGDVVTDIWEIISKKTTEGPSVRECLGLHREMDTALQIVLVTQSFDVGQYVKDKYWNNWRLVE